MKRYLLLSMMFLLFVAGAAFSVEDNFHITVTVDFLEIELDSANCVDAYGTWKLGQHAAGYTDSMTTGGAGNHICVINGNNCTTDFSAYVSSANPGPCGYGSNTAWTAGGSVGADTYKLDLGHDDDGADYPGTWYNITSGSTPGNDFYTDVAAGTDFHLFARLSLPNPVSDGCQHDIQVTIVALQP
ncbi:hypothetical protein JXI42_03660 [bacterium]|nr:hypothetical protein [bacterium]